MNQHTFLLCPPNKPAKKTADAVKKAVEDKLTELRSDLAEYYDLYESEDITPEEKAQFRKLREKIYLLEEILNQETN